MCFRVQGAGGVRSRGRCCISSIGSKCWQAVSCTRGVGKPSTSSSSSSSLFHAAGGLDPYVLVDETKSNTTSSSGSNWSDLWLGWVWLVCWF